MTRRKSIPLTEAHTRTLEALAREFARFRETHHSRARIPDALREHALSALADGVARTPVAGACGVTSSTLSVWQERRDRENGRCEVGDSQKARVFSVMPKTTPGLGSVELRVEGWSLTISRNPGTE